MRVDYSKLFNKIKENNMTQKTFKELSNISGGTLNKLLHGEGVTTNTICNICDFFHCMPDEIMEFMPDDNYPANVVKRQKTRLKIENQIAELQEELKEKQDIEAQISELQKQLDNL